MCFRKRLTRASVSRRRWPPWWADWAAPTDWGEPAGHRVQGSTPRCRMLLGIHRRPRATADEVANVRREEAASISFLDRGHQNGTTFRSVHQGRRARMSNGYDTRPEAGCRRLAAVVGTPGSGTSQARQSGSIRSQAAPVVREVRPEPPAAYHFPDPVAPVLRSQNQTARLRRRVRSSAPPAVAMNAPSVR